MAYYAALLNIIELLHDILHPHRFPNSFPKNLTPTFSSLHQKFSQLLDALQDYSSIGGRIDAHLVETRIRDASYQAHDVIESQIPKHHHHLSIMIYGMFTKMSVQRFVLKKKLQKVAQEVDSIVQHLTAIKKVQTGEHQVSTATSSPQDQKQLAPIDFRKMVGFEEQLLAIKEKLCGSLPRLEVIPIVGMGGIGKTTLATHTFHDPLIVSKFDFRGWVTISQDFHVIRVLQDIVKSLGITVRFPDELSSRQDKALERALKDAIHKHLKWRKFLVVIDDIWDTQVWDDIKQIFPNDCNASRVVLTTRLGEVAEYVGTVDSVHHMQFLNADASWSLLQHKIFANDSCPSELVNIGKCIASKCKGLPIAIVVMGGILLHDKTLEHWERIAEDVSTSLSKDGEHLFNILSMSYQHLPHHLKPCFLLMGAFPEDDEIDISKLIRLWMGEGFLGMGSSSKDYEKIGEDYIQDLVKRNVVIIKGSRASDAFKSCIMHDVLRDFCIRKGVDEHFFDVMDSKGHRKNGARRIWIGPEQRLSSLIYFTAGQRCHSVYWLRKGRFQFYDYDYSEWGGGSGLRVLEAPGECFSGLAPNMLHLKHLGLQYGGHFGSYIQRSVSMFQNLETLIIRGITSSLPPEIWNMLWLRYLIIDNVILPPIPLDVPCRQKLQHLHTLQTVDNFVFTNEVTQTIPNVKKLNIKHESLKYAWELYGINNLLNLIHLEKLNIDAYHDFFNHPKIDLMRSKFAFPQNLKELSLSGCGLPWEAMTLVGSLKYLQVLKLRIFSFVGDAWEPEEEAFSELKFLLLEELPTLKEWRAESTHFPKLQHLKIIRCTRLEEIPSDMGEIGTLKSITVAGCKKAAGESAKKIEEEQQELGNYDLQVIVVRDDEEEDEDEDDEDQVVEDDDEDQIVEDNDDDDDKHRIGFGPSFRQLIRVC